MLPSSGSPPGFFSLPLWNLVSLSQHIVYSVLEISGHMCASLIGLWAFKDQGRTLPLFHLFQNTLFYKYLLMDFFIPLAISLDMIFSQRDNMRALNEESRHQTFSPDYALDAV